MTNRIGGAGADPDALDAREDRDGRLPDSNKVGVWPLGKLFRIEDAVDYYDGEL